MLPPMSGWDEDGSITCDNTESRMSGVEAAHAVVPYVYIWHTFRLV